MSFSQIFLDISNHVAQITLNRPEVYNAISDVMRQELKDAVDLINKELGVRVVTVTGAGKAFCAGGDLRAMAERNNEHVPFHDLRKANRWRTGDTIRKIKTVKQPVIAVLNGAAIGAGLGLALACDMRVASETAKLGFAFVKRGLPPDWGNSYFLPRLVGTARAMELVCTGRNIDAETALAYGLLNKVVPHDELNEYTNSLCEEIVQNAPIAVAASKESVYYGAAYDLDAALEYEAFNMSMCKITEDHKEGTLAFLEKRTPVFNGR